MIAINQFAIYQLKDIPENRDIRFRSYKTLREDKSQIHCDNYKQRYIGRLVSGDTPESIRSRLKKQTPRTFTGHSISVSDVIVLNEAGVVTSYYVERDGFTVIHGFIRNISSSAVISLDTTDFCIAGKEGTWLAFDNIVINGKEFFLMEHTTYGNEAANVVLDGTGKLIVDHVCHGFDGKVQDSIKEYSNSELSVSVTEKQEKTSSLLPKPRKIGDRISVLDRLHLKQAELGK